MEIDSFVHVGECDYNNAISVVFTANNDATVGFVVSKRDWNIETLVRELRSAADRLEAIQ